MNTFAVLDRQTIATVLEDRWLPRTLAGGALTRTELEVAAEHWHEEDLASRTPDASPDVVEEQGARPQNRARVELSVDARLRRVWRRRLDFEPLGIAGARVNSHSTVIAVVDREPPAYETQELLEDFGAVYDDKSPSLVVVKADSYESIVKGWFRQLEVGTGLLAEVRADETRDRLVVTLPQKLSHPRWQGPDGSQVTALRRLLPYQVVDITVGS
jgi:hypothetical protein